MGRPLSIFLIVALVGFDVVLLFPDTGRYLIPAFFVGTVIASVIGFSKTMSMLKRLWTGKERLLRKRERMNGFEGTFYVVFIVTILISFVRFVS